MKAPLMFITGGSGGLGKSFTARALAHALGARNHRTVLVDGNPGQQSQRAYLNISRTHALEAVTRDNPLQGLVLPPDTHGAFALLPGPAMPGPDTLNQYGLAISLLRDAVDYVIVDADRTDATLWTNPHSFPGAIMRPFLTQTDALCCFRLGQTGSQLGDGLAALNAIQLPDQCHAIGQVAAGVHAQPEHWWKQCVKDLAIFDGIDQWDTTSTRILEHHKPGYPVGQEPDWLRRLALALHANPTEWPEPKRKRSWFH